MKKLKIAVLAAIVLLLLVIAFFSFFYGGASRLESASKLPRQELVARGEYLARAGDCVACHTAQNGKPFAGGLGIASPIGTIYSTNITPDKRHGIGDYTLRDFDDALRHGARKNGDSLYPAMPFPSFAIVTDEDVEALYAYFMHGVEAVPEPNKAPDIPWPLSMRWPLGAWRMLFSPAVGPFAPAESQNTTIARGAYLVQGLGHCGSCHTPRNITLDEKAYSDMGNLVFLSGGAAPIDGWIAVNLRGDHTDGLGDVAQEELFEVLKTGRNTHSAVFGGMADVVNHSLQYLTDDDLHAIAQYLKTLSPVDAKDTPFAYDEATAKALYSGDDGARGAALYIDNCAACHRTSGKGYAGVFPALAGNPVVQGKDPASVINLILQGHMLHGTRGAVTAFAMPSLGWRLDDREVADVASFVRTGWGNKGQAVTAAEVAKYRTQ